MVVATLAVRPLAAAGPAPARRAQPRLQPPTTARRAAHLRVAAGGGDEQPPASGEQQRAAEPATAPRPAAPVDVTVAKGQRTAIVTGAISIIFGVIYLGLVSFLDIRGGELLPPPPEAFIP